MEFPKTAQGEMQPASYDDVVQDEQGFTHPNLHRRVEWVKHDGEVREREYIVGVFDSINSTRLTEVFIRDEESPDCDIP